MKNQLPKCIIGKNLSLLSVLKDSQHPLDTDFAINKVEIDQKIETFDFEEHENNTEISNMIHKKELMP